MSQVSVSIHDLFHPKSSSSVEEAREVLFKDGTVLADAVRAVVSDSDDFESSWNVFLSQLGELWINQKYGTNKKIKASLAFLIDSGYDSVDILRAHFGKRRDRFKQDVRIAPVHQSFIYDKIIDCEVPKENWLLQHETLPNKRLRTEAGIKGASDFSKKEFHTPGIGFSQANEFDPSPNGIVFHKLQPAADDIQDPNYEQEIVEIASLLQGLSSSTAGLVPLGEEEFVQQAYDDFASKLGFSKQVKMTFCPCDSPSPATSKSKMDGGSIVRSPFDDSSFWATSVWENKGMEASPSAGVRQAGAGYGFGIATGLRGLGVPASEIVVPVIVCTGALIQFGAVFLLEPTFPIYTHVSPVFDLENFEMATTAARFIVKARKTAKENHNALLRATKGQSIPPDLSSMDMVLSLDQYFVKSLDPGCEQDSGLLSFGYSQMYGCRHMFRVYNELWSKLDPEQRSCVVFPHGFREKDIPQKKGGGDAAEQLNLIGLIFPNLCWTGATEEPFRTGLPDPSERATCEAWLCEVERVFYLIHRAGLVHVDPYPSNIMFRVGSDGAVEIRIVDWDVAHSVERDRHWSRSTALVMKAIAEERKGMGWTFFDSVSPEHDLQYLRLLRTIYAGIEENHEICVELASNDVQRINEGFRKAARSISIESITLSQLTGYAE